jgi:general secretion pathway protein L
VTDALLLFLGPAGGIDGWLRVEGGAVAERGAGSPPVRLGEAAVAVVPGEQVTLHWLDIPAGLAAAQAAAAARMLAAEASAEPVSDVHVAVGRETEGALRCIALVQRAAMAGWIETVRGAGFEAEKIVPESVLLPEPEEGYLRFARGPVSLYRGREAAFAMEPELAGLIVGDAPVADISPQQFEGGLAEAAARPLVDLRQGPFARKREWRLQKGRLRRLAVAASALVLATLAVEVAQVMRLTLAADAAEEETRRIAGATLKSGAGTNPAAALERRLAELRGGGVGFGAIAAAVFAAVRASPNVELSALSFAPDGSLGLTAQGDNAATLADLARRIEASGFRVEKAPPRSAAGRQLQPMRVVPR